MTDEVRNDALARIRSNIERFGHHIYVVVEEQCPRFAYTIGLSPVIGHELLLAGGEVYSKNEIHEIITRLGTDHAPKLRAGVSISVGSLGSFLLRKVDTSWAKEFVVGAIDYYETVEIPVLQVVPDEDHWTVDVPDLEKPRIEGNEPVWRWLTEPWLYPIPANSTPVTNLPALRGKLITEVMRWEDDEWEMFAGAGPDVPREQVRVIPLGILLGADPSLAPIIDLKKGAGLWRDADGRTWHEWRKGTGPPTNS